MKRILLAAAVGLTSITAAALTAGPAFAALTIGASAPEFSAKGMLGGKEFTFKLSDALKKGPVVVYFFPAAYTPGCTLETQLFADAADQFKAAGATLIGVTGGAKLADGSMASASENLTRLAEFSKEHCRDRFPIAAVSADTISKYNVVMPQRTELSDRTSYVIGKDGKIILSHTTQKPDEHITKTLAAVKSLSGGAHKH
jgi:peroxiredoxin